MISKFKLYGQDNPMFFERIQPILPIRSWTCLDQQEKEIIWQELFRQDWFQDNRLCVVDSVTHLNDRFKRKIPGKEIFQLSNRDSDLEQQFNAANNDFKNILINGEPEELVLRMLSFFASCFIDSEILEEAEKSNDCENRKNQLDTAYEKFDKFINLLNDIFEQFSVNVVASRCGMVPRQDDHITKDIYVPTLKILSDPKWNSVNSILKDMFSDCQNRQYPEVITKAHSAVHSFLQIALGVNGNSGKGEFGNLFGEAKSNNLISKNREVKCLISWIREVLPSERATKSTAKPAAQATNYTDALLVMNVSMVLMQHILLNMAQDK